MPAPVTAKSADVAILGGGLAGLCLAVQISRRRPATRVLVIERRGTPAPLAAFKVGESSVEIGSYYFQSVLGLTDLLGQELRKFGLRFFFSAAGNDDITRRLECGPSRYFSVPSYQIDRGRFESSLTEHARLCGAEVLSGHAVKDVVGLDEPGPKRITCVGPDGTVEIEAPWVIDASGRAELLKRRLDIKESTRHLVNASWFRVDANIDIDTWSDDSTWTRQIGEPRRLSTNHLMGAGYWVWLIPLSGGQTSVGIVASDDLHPFDSIRTFERSLEWLERNEPQLHRELGPHLDSRLDFLTCKHFARSATKVFSAAGWCLTGEAGYFNDPLYSPGSDFIGIGNGFITDLVCRQLDGEDIDERTATYQRRFAGIFRTVMTIYLGQYPIMGSPRVMSLKILWDFVMYWGGVALIYMHGKLHDNALMDRAHELLLSFASEGFQMQRMLRRWSEQDRDETVADFFDYCSMPVLEELNEKLVEPMDDDALLAQLTRNLGHAKSLAAEIRAQAARCDPRLAPEAADAPVTSTHLVEMIAALWPPPGGTSDQHTRR